MNTLKAGALSPRQNGLLMLAHPSASQSQSSQLLFSHHLTQNSFEASESQRNSFLETVRDGGKFKHHQQSFVAKPIFCNFSYFPNNMTMFQVCFVSVE